MAQYKKLTKKITDDEGNNVAVCSFYGTEQCQQVHTSQFCPTCPMLQVFLEQLNAFEEVYAEVENAS